MAIMWCIFNSGCVNVSILAFYGLTGLAWKGLAGLVPVLKHMVLLTSFLDS